MSQPSFDWRFEIPTWEKIYEFLLNLASHIKKAGFKPDIIVGIARGGWLPARILSDLLENPEIADVKAEFYLSVAEAKGEPVITQPVSVPVRGKKVLVVDDVADTGKSLTLIQKHLKEKGAKNIKTATIYYKPWSTLTPDWFEKKTSRWIIFPWERKETIRRILEKCKKHGKTTKDAKEILINYGLDRKLVDKFIKEIFEEKT
jgi:hypoxanthine phosphoribosyltransferase